MKTITLTTTEIDLLIAPVLEILSSEAWPGENPDEKTIIANWRAQPQEFRDMRPGLDQEADLAERLIALRDSELVPV